MGNIESKMAKRKAKLFDNDPSMSSNLVDVTVLPNDMLLSLTSKCDINVENDREEQVHNLAFIMARESKCGEEGIKSQYALSTKHDQNKIHFLEFTRAGKLRKMEDG